MPLTSRLRTFGTLILLGGALVVTFFAFALLGMRVALRTRDVLVPDMTGAPVERARQIAAEAGLSVRVDPAQRPDERVPAGSVLMQDPASGTEVRQQRSIRLWVSSGPHSATLPILTGQGDRAALLRAQQDGIEIATITEFSSPDYAANAVVAQDPAPGARVTRTSLLVNREAQAATYVMPDLVGTRGAEAADAMRVRGFRISIVGTQSYPGAPAGTVVSQQPPGGFQVGTGDSISLEVSR